MVSPLSVVAFTQSQLALTDNLPLTCTRAGACCHGNSVWLNPWELARMAVLKGVSSRQFRDAYGEFGGISLHFNKKSTEEGLAACSQYDPTCGCTVYANRPLACRLFPLARKRQGTTIGYLHRGKNFPCLKSCPEVAHLPYRTVAEYLTEQDVTLSALAQDQYLELVQQLADGAFGLLFETELASSSIQLTLRLWRDLGNMQPENLEKQIGQEWIDRLMLPDIRETLNDPAAFTHQHYQLLQLQADESFGNLSDIAMLRNASGIMLGLALHLSRGLGANPAELCEHWVATAKKLVE